MNLFSPSNKTKIPSPEASLPGRETPIQVPEKHFVNHHSVIPPYPENYLKAIFGMGCFWGAEKLFWKTKGVFVTSVGYAGGHTPNPTYEEVCSGLTGQNEVVQVIYNPAQINYNELLTLFWQGHNPTQGMRQGNDGGTQYRSAIYTLSEAQFNEAQISKNNYQKQLSAANYETITTEIKPASIFYFAEGYHQQYLAKNPGGYCGLGGTGVKCN